ncbi:MAG: HAD family phosphatase [Selenomonadaceae bacterium]|nr:HAD family phosphatase [Selenomonadaceae bacterium]
MAVKLFVSDIDGTLLDSGKKVSEKNIEAVQKMVERGIIVTIATGRMYRAAVPVAQELGVDVPIITYNGALIKTLRGEVLYEKCLPPEIVVEVTNFFEKNNWYIQNYSEDNLYFPEYNDHAKFYENSQKVHGQTVGWDGMKKKTSHVCKMLGISNSLEETEKISAAVKKEFGDKISVTRSTPIFNEIVCPGISKASAIKILAEKFNADISEVMAIGDSDNDLPMLKTAGKSIAMGNAADHIKAVCDYTTGLCENDGFAEAVYKYVL